MNFGMSSPPLAAATPTGRIPSVSRLSSCPVFRATTRFLESTPAEADSDDEEEVEFPLFELHAVTALSDAAAIKPKKVLREILRFTYLNVAYPKLKLQ